MRYLEDTGLIAYSRWSIASDREAWRALRPIIGQVFQWVSVSSTIDGLSPDILEFEFNQSLYQLSVVSRKGIQCQQKSNGHEIVHGDCITPMMLIIVLVNNMFTVYRTRRLPCTLWRNGCQMSGQLLMYSLSYSIITTNLLTFFNDVQVSREFSKLLVCRG